MASSFPVKILLRYFTVLTALAVVGLHAQTTTTGATFGTIVSLGATPSDLVLDESRGQIYLVNTAGNRIDILNEATNTVTGNIPVGTGPLSAAMSMDNNFLYVTNGTAVTLSVINLQMKAVTQTVTLPATPQGVEVGADGRALVSTVGTGTSTAAVNTLLIYDQTQPTGSPNQLIAVATPPTPTTPSPLPSQTLAKPDTTFTGKLIRTPNGQYIVGLTNPATNVCTGSTTATGCTYLFVYEVSSGTILRSRNVNGQSTVLSMSPDGSRFMAGYTLYDVATLSVLAQMNNANAPFTYSATYSVRQNIGGSVFSNDGKTIYGAFNVAAFTTPPPPSNSSTLMLTDSTSLGIQLGIKLPESIVARMVSTADGTKIWCLSQSGIVYLPISTLYKYPILQPSSTQVFLSQNPCNPRSGAGQRTDDQCRRRQAYVRGHHAFAHTHHIRQQRCCAGHHHVHHGTGPSHHLHTPARDQSRQLHRYRRHALRPVARYHDRLAAGHQRSAADSRLHELSPVRSARSGISDSGDAEQFAERNADQYHRQQYCGRPRAWRISCSTSLAIASISRMPDTTASRFSTP